MFGTPKVGGAAVRGRPKFLGNNKNLFRPLRALFSLFLTQGFGRCAASTTGWSVSGFGACIVFFA
jgi:hypothetical protein